MPNMDKDEEYFGTASAFICPNSRYDAGSRVKATYVSYGMSRYGMGNGNTPSGTVSTGYVKEPPSPPDDTLVLVDNGTAAAPHGYFIAYCDAAFQYFRHAGLANVLYADGHCDSADYRKLVGDSPSAKTNASPWYGGNAAIIKKAYP
ncbi:hypothetical protein SDC9_162794 [bioreactor metagenome]|uniref:Uncharacterized protein n=1 Tax=bioreactor metagenome TaxID=1076179 RepID=A0A645FNE2_9ZZZZ